MIKHFIPFTLVVFLVSGNCPFSSELPNLQAGSASLALRNDVQDPTSSYTISFKTAFLNLPTIAISIQKISVNTQTIKKWILIGADLSKAQGKISFSYERNRWNEISVSYWVGDRSDLVLGYSRIELGEISAQTKQYSISFAKSLKRPTRSVVRPFITGYIASSLTAIAIKINQKELQQRSFKLIVEIGEKIKLNQLIVSYMAFDFQGQAQFSSYGGAILETNFQSTKIYNLHKNIYNSPYVFVGFYHLQLNGNGPFGFTSQIQSPLFFRISVSRSIENFAMTYIVIGHSPSSFCEKCQQKYIYNNECIGDCPNNTFEMEYKDGGKACQTCPLRYNYVVDKKQRKCSCREGFAQISGFCSFQNLSPTSNTASQKSQGQTQTTTETGNSLSVNNQNSNSFTAKGNNSSQSFVPTTNPITNPPPTTTNPLPTTTTEINKNGQNERPKYEEKDCSYLSNSYWTGYECNCKVGFLFKNGICTSTSFTEPYKPPEFLHRIPNIYKKPNCTKPFEHEAANTCVCNQGYYRAENGSCVKINCSSNRKFVNGNCACIDGFEEVNGYCQKICPQNSIDNGLGQCICLKGHYRLENGFCVVGEPCHPFSVRDGQGKCRCITGYIDYGDHCAKCKEGYFQSENDNRCIKICGQNQVAKGDKCECLEDYGIINKKCAKCPQDYFIDKGYCVSCPQGSFFDLRVRNCQCKEEQGYFKGSNGFCQFKCSNLGQVFDYLSGKCQCSEGLGYSENNECVTCEFGVNPSTFTCFSGCKKNQIPYNGSCRCKNGYGWNLHQQCIDCATINGGFLLDGICGVCPNSFVFNGRQCVCPPNSVYVDNFCLNTCKPGQLVDGNGECYWCLLNQVPVQGKCQCKSGYQRVDGHCEFKCPPSKVLVNGICARCAINTVYNTKLKSCVCEDGFYKNNHGFCEPSHLLPTQCQKGYYYNQTDGCLPCLEGCLQCKNAQLCTNCPEYYIPNQGSCIAECGDGYIVRNSEQCDDDNLNSGDGCFQCKIEDGWICEGVTFSVCRRMTGSACGNGKIDLSEQCDDKGRINGDGCSAFCLIEEGWTCQNSPSVCSRNTNPEAKGMKLVQTLTNVRDVFVLLELDSVFIFSSDEEMRNFIKYDFPTPNSVPTNGYCLNEKAAPKLFRCLFIYPSGIPNFPFQIDFSYNSSGKTGFLPVQVDPLAAPLNSRQLT